MKNTELTNEEIVLSYESLGEIQSVVFSEAEVDFHFEVAENVQSLKKHYETYQGALTSLYKTYCEKDERGKPLIKNNQYQFKGDDMVKLNDKINELLGKKIKVEINYMKKSDFKGVKGIKPKVISGLLPLFDKK